MSIIDSIRQLFGMGAPNERLQDAGVITAPVLRDWRGLFHGDLTPDQFTQAYRSTVAMLMRYRANNFAPHLLASRVERRDAGGWEQVEPDHNWVRLLRRPNSYMPPLQFWQWVTLSRDGVGHADLIVEHQRITIAGVTAMLPATLHPVFPEYGHLEPVLGTTGEVTSWLYWRADGRRITLGVEDVVRIKRVHPVSPRRTASLIEAAAYEIDQDTAANVYGRDAMRSQGMPDVMLETDQKMDAGTLRQVSNDFARMYSAGRRAGVPVSHGGLHIKPLTLSQRDTQFVEQRQFIRTVLYQVFESHEGLFSDKANRANADAALYGFAVNTIQPNVSDIANQFEFELERIHRADVDALRIAVPNVVPRDEKEQAQIDEIRVRSGVLSPNEIRRRDGMDPYEGGDEYLISAGLTHLSGLNSGF